MRRHCIGSGASPTADISAPCSANAFLYKGDCVSSCPPRFFGDKKGTLLDLAQVEGGPS